MKNRYFLSFILFLLFSSIGFTQNNKLAGTWLGTLDAGGIELRVVFHIKDEGKDNFTTTADSPDQSAYGLKADTTIVNGNTITIKMISLYATYTGELTDDSTIRGTFTQQVDIPLILKRTTKVAERNRPQTPKAPFPYQSEDIIFSNRDSTLHYGATITLPEGEGPFPAIALITGSGPQDRDETILGHKLFAVLADHLTRKGFIVLRTDDRGVNKSTGDFSTATSEDFSSDISSRVDYLLSRSEVDKKKIGLIGHSEGGMIAPMVAAKRLDIDFIVLMAGPGVKIIDLMAKQNEAIARSAGTSEATLKEIQPLFRQIVSSILQAPDSITAFHTVSTALENWSVTKNKEMLEELNLGTAKQRIDYINAMIQQLQSPWFRYFINFDPQQYLGALNCKVLAVNGDKDIQVSSAQNLPGIEAALKSSASKNYEIKELKGLNHLFQTCKQCTVSEYGELEETISPAALNFISSWLEKNVK